MIERLRPHPHRGDVIAAGAVPLSLAAVLIDLRMIQWPIGVRFAVVALITVLIMSIGWQAELEHERPRPYHSVLRRWRLAPRWRRWSAGSAARMVRAPCGRSSWPSSWAKGGGHRASRPKPPSFGRLRQRRAGNPGFGGNLPGGRGPRTGYTVRVERLPAADRPGPGRLRGSDREPGPGYLGLAVLAAFVLLAAAPVAARGSLVGWPLFLLLIGGAGLAIGLRPRRPLPPAPDANMPGPAPTVPLHAEKQ